MNRYDELEARGRALDAKNRLAMLRGLAADERFVALVALLDDGIEEFSKAACSQSLSDSHGKLAHANGSVHGLRWLRSQMAAALSGKEKPRSEQPPDE